MPVLGYDVDRPSKRLVANEEEAKLVRHIFKRFCQLGSTTELAGELNAQGHRTKAWTTAKGTTQGGRPWNKAHLYRLLNNRKYIGEIEHKGTFYPGEHEAIVPQTLWDDAHKILAENYAVRANRTRAKTPALLKGIIRCGHCGGAMGPTFTRKNGKTYRYYLCVHASKNGYKSCPVRTVAAGTIETAVVEQLRAVFRSPELIAQTFRSAKSREGEELERLRHEKAELLHRLRVLKEMAARLIDASGNGGGAIAEDLRRSGDEIDDVKRRLEIVADEVRGMEASEITERDVIEALERLDPVWDELFPAEQARIVQLLLDRVDVAPEGIDLRLRTDGLRSLVAEIAVDQERDLEATAR